MHFLASFNCICSQFRSRDLHHVFIPVPMCASKDGFLRFFPACVDFHSLKLSLWLLHLGLFLHLNTSVAIVKCIRFLVSLQFIRALPQICCMVRF